jgi:hypothetical protein
VGTTIQKSEVSGLDLNCLRGVVSDGASGLIAYLYRTLFMLRVIGRAR